MSELESTRIVEELQQLLSEKERVLNYLNSLNEQIYVLNQRQVQLQEEYISRLTEQFEMARNDPRPIVIDDSNDEEEEGEDEAQKALWSNSTSEMSAVGNPYNIPRVEGQRKPRNTRLVATKRAYKKRCLDPDSSSGSDSSDSTYSN